MRVRTSIKDNNSKREWRHDKLLVLRIYWKVQLLTVVGPFCCYKHLAHTTCLALFLPARQLPDTKGDPITLPPLRFFLTVNNQSDSSKVWITNFETVSTSGRWQSLEKCGLSGDKQIQTMWLSDIDAMVTELLDSLSRYLSKGWNHWANDTVWVQRAYRSINSSYWPPMMIKLKLQTWRHGMVKLTLRL